MCSAMDIIIYVQCLMSSIFSSVFDFCFVTAPILFVAESAYDPYDLYRYEYVLDLSPFSQSAFE